MLGFSILGAGPDIAAPVTARAAAGRHRVSKRVSERQGIGSDPQVHGVAIQGATLTAHIQAVVARVSEADVAQHEGLLGCPTNVDSVL